MKRLFFRIGLSEMASLLFIALLSVNSYASIIGVSGPVSDFGTAAQITPSPSDVFNDSVTNTGQQGFDEAQGVLTTIAHGVDGGSISAGTLVDSHMIFLNFPTPAIINHFNVEWVFDGHILGVMSDRDGFLEVPSTFELGAPGTNYPTIPFTARGMEFQSNCRGGSDGYSIVATNRLCVDMRVGGTGDWIRVVTAASASVPEPATLALMGLGLAGIGCYRRHRRKIAA